MTVDIYKPTTSDDLSLVELELYHLIMEYRATLGLDPIQLSKALTTTAGRHALDTAYNIWGTDMTLPDGANLHSWSDAPYFSDHRDPAVMWYAPDRLGVTYPSEGFEISAAGYAAGVGAALGGWQNSPGHNAVIANLNAWTNYDWNAIGVGVEFADVDPYGGRIYHVWFGTAEDPSGPPEIEGTEAAETIDGTQWADVIKAGGGNDTVTGEGGADALYGQADRDMLIGGQGSDALYGGSGSDTISGGAGSDTVVGGNGRDEVRLGGGADLFRDNGQGGARGQDRVFAGNGADTIEGGGGADAFYGQNGADEIFGRKGADALFGGNGSDTIKGGAGADRVYGGNGRDLVDLGAGRDVFFDNAQTGPAGSDTITGGAGADRFVFGSAIAEEVITDFEVGVDALAIAAGLAHGQSAAEIASAASVVGDDLVLDFGSGQTITLEGLSSTAGLAASLEIL